MNIHDDSCRYINLNKCIVVLLVFIAIICTACGRFTEVDPEPPEPVSQTTDYLPPVDVPMPSDADLALAYMADNNIFNELMSTSDYDLDRTITYGEYAHLIMNLKSATNLPDMRLCPGDQTDFSMLPPGYQYYDDIIQACSTGWFSTVFLNELDEPMPNQTLQTYIAKLSEIMYDEYFDQFEMVRINAYSDEDAFYAALSESDQAAELNAIVKRMLHKSYQAGVINPDKDGVFRFGLTDFVTVRYFAEHCYSAVCVYTNFH